MELVCHLICVSFSFSRYLQKVSAFTFPLGVNESFGCSSSPIFGISHPLFKSHMVSIPHSFRFISLMTHVNSFLYLLAILTFFGEVLVLVICPALTGLFFLFISIYGSYLYVLDSRHLRNICIIIPCYR